MLRTLARSALLVTALATVPALAAPADDAVKPIKSVVQSIRFGKDKLALTHFASEAQGAYLMEDAWTTGTPAQRKEFSDLFHELFAKIAFPKVRDNFKNLASITYDPPQFEGETATVNSVVLIDHPLKKQELKLKYTVVKEGKAWRVKDVSVLGESMLQGVRDEQARPILKEGGWNAIMVALRAKAKELEKVELK
jgi:phospholipid transport system substrate-binding protein